MNNRTNKKHLFLIIFMLVTILVIGVFSAYSLQQAGNASLSDITSNSPIINASRRIEEAKPAAVAEPYSDSGALRVRIFSDKDDSKAWEYSLQYLSIINISSLGGTIPDYVNTPEEIENWFLKDFTFAAEMSDKWQSPEETISLKRGDSEDFAILASFLLTRLKMPNSLIILESEEMTKGQVICLWKSRETGLYGIFSDLEYYETGEKELFKAISKIYPDWETIIFTNEKKEDLLTIERSSS